jgi:hypothetical protein
MGTNCSYTIADYFINCIELIYIKNMQKSQLEEKYSNKVLGIRLYNSEKNKFYIADFLDISLLSSFIDELYCCESDITQDGIKFLEENYGFSNLANILLTNNKLKEDIKNYSEADLTNWLRTQKPLITSDFINKSKANNVNMINIS